MRKLHWLIGEHTACRPNTNDKLKREIASKVPDITCIPCLKALGLNKILFKASSKHAKAFITFSGNKRQTAECLMTSFEMIIESAPISEDAFDDHDAAMSFIGKEPEPIKLRMDLTESGRQAIYELLFNMGLKK